MICLFQIFSIANREKNEIIFCEVGFFYVRKWVDRREEVEKMVTRKVGKYEVGRTIGEGTFAKVKFAQNTETAENVAMKVLSKSTILKHKMVEQVVLSTLFLVYSFLCSLISAWLELLFLF